MFCKIISELGRLLNLPDLAPDASGALTLRIDGQDFILQYFEQGQELYIIHRLGTLPEEPKGRTRMQSLLLERNCFLRGVGPGAIGTEGSDIYYTVRLSAGSLDGRTLEQAMRSATAVCDRLRRDMDGLSAPEGSILHGQTILWG